MCAVPDSKVCDASAPLIGRLLMYTSYALVVELPQDYVRARPR